MRIESSIALKAKVEGAFSSVTWSFVQKNKVVAKVKTDLKDGVAAGSYVPTRGGLYDVIVTAEGLAGKLSEELQIYVKPQR